MESLISSFETIVGGLVRALRVHTAPFAAARLRMSRKTRPGICGEGRHPGNAPLPLFVRSGGGC
jgi:hypothetical protein